MEIISGRGVGNQYIVDSAAFGENTCCITVSPPTFKSGINKDTVQIQEIIVGLRRITYTCTGCTGPPQPRARFPSGSTLIIPNTKIIFKTK